MIANKSSPARDNPVRELEDLIFVYAGNLTTFRFQLAVGGAAMPKKCETCDEPAVSGERYCPACKKRIKAEMKDAGYLTRTSRRSYRTTDQQENTYETKHGKGHG